MRQKGFATVFGICLLLVVALLVKGIQESEANHANEVYNFETEQILQQAAESELIKEAETLRQITEKPETSDEVRSRTVHKTFKSGNHSLEMTIDVRSAHGKISHGEDSDDGYYIMAWAKATSEFTNDMIYRRAYGYIIDGDEEVCFLQVP